MATRTVRLGSPTQNTGVAVGGSFPTIWRDDLDTTYVELDFGEYVGPAPADNYALLTGEQVRSVQVRFRHMWSLGAAPAPKWRVELRTLSGMIYTLFQIPTTGIRTDLVATFWQPPTTVGTVWTQAVLDDINIYAKVDTNGTIRLYEVYLDLITNEAPVTTVSAPTGSHTVSRPTIEWSNADPEGDAQERYWVKIFSDAQYLAGGFNPETSTATWDSGEVSSGSTSVVPTVDLANDVYRAYVKTADVGSNGRYGSWAYSEFTVAADPPATPVLVATLESGLARTKLDITGNVADVATYFVLEYSDDAGLTWITVRGGSRIIPSGTQTATVYDYEQKPGVVRQYRAKGVLEVTATAIVGSPYSTVVSTTWTTTNWWIKDPLAPANNFKVTEGGVAIVNEGQHERLEIHEPMNREDPVVFSAGIGKWDGSFSFVAKTLEVPTAEALLKATNALLVQSPDGEHRYLRPMNRNKNRGPFSRRYTIDYLETLVP